jgi:hypothetical protein
MRTLLLPALLLLSACSTTVVRGGPAPSRGPGAVAAPPADGKVWVCHGGRQAKWQQVSQSAARAHERHGDRVSTRAHLGGARCRD